MKAATFLPPYEARRPTASILYQTLAESLTTFMDEPKGELCFFYADRTSRWPVEDPCYVNT